MFFEHFRLFFDQIRFRCRFRLTWIGAHTLSPIELCAANVTAIAPSSAVTSANRANFVADKPKPPAN